MPCYSPYDDKSREELEQEASKVLFELKITTQFACECLTKLEKENSPIPEYMKDWWEKYKKLEQEASNMWRELKITTRFTCECLTKLEEENSPIPEYIKVWWENHKEWDKRRKENEQRQKDLLNEDIKKWEQILNAVENGVEVLFPPELLNAVENGVEVLFPPELFK